MAEKTATPPAEKPKDTKAMTPFEEVKRNLMSEETQKQFAMALPPQMKPEKFLRVAITAINKTPDILKCDRRTLYQSFMLAAQDGLLPDGREAAIVPFGNAATYMPMVGGLLKKIRNSGELKSIVAEVIHKNDSFERWIDERGEHMRHEPLTFGERGDIIGVYALAMTTDEGIYIEVMTKAEVEEVRNVSKAKNAGPWTQWWGQMAKKTAIRRLSKRLPMSSDLEDFMRRDDERTVDLGSVSEKGAETKKGSPNRLEKMLGGAHETVIEGESQVVSEEAQAEAPSTDDKK